MSKCSITSRRLRVDRDKLLTVTPEGPTHFHKTAFDVLDFMADDLRPKFWRENEAEILEGLRRIPPA